jgi:hypothetical protein
VIEDVERFRDCRDSYSMSELENSRESQVGGIEEERPRGEVVVIAGSPAAARAVLMAAITAAGQRGWSMMGTLVIWSVAAFPSAPNVMLFDGTGVTQ